MLTIRKLGTSRGRLEYYDAQVAAGVEDYYAGRGESAGQWRGAGVRAKLGYLSARKEPGKTRERTIYTLTDKAMDALRNYARTPVAFTPLKSDALLRLLICDLVGEEVTRASMATLRDDIADLESRLEGVEQSAHQLAHREKYLLLVTTFMRRVLGLHLELVDQVDRELQPQAAAETPG